ncbi:hypothetical protein LEMLEM_LOCUS7569 [Lemmus lemmus]
MKPALKNLTGKYIQHGPAMAQQIKAATKPDDPSWISWDPHLGRRKPVAADYHLTPRSKFWHGIEKFALALAIRERRNI